MLLKSLLLAVVGNGRWKRPIESPECDSGAQSLCCVTLLHADSARNQKRGQTLQLIFNLYRL